MKNYEVILCRYGETALKGKNRHLFEKLIVQRIKQVLKNDIDELKVDRITGRIIISLNKLVKISEEQAKIIQNKLQYVIGITSYSFAITSNTDNYESIKEIANSITSILIKKIKNENNKNEISFRIRVNRVYKKIELSTKEIETLMADYVLSNFPYLKINLTNADITIYCEMHKDTTYIFDKKIDSERGLPVSSNDSALVMISGGFDSPVAAYLSMKRGIKLDFIFFHSYPLTPIKTIDKIKSIVEILNQYQGDCKIFICNILEIQKEIITEVLESYRTIHYRRIMLKISEMIANKNNNKAIITGDSIGQVASQTLVNVDAMNKITEKLILRPVITMNKEDIIKISNTIKTYEISKIQTPESCTVFLPKNPSTRVNMDKILKYENKINMDKILNIAYTNTIVYDTKTKIEINMGEYKGH